MLFHLVPSAFDEPRFSLPAAVFAIAFGWVCRRQPWSQWRPEAQLVYPLVGTVLTAIASRGAPQTGFATVLAAYTVLFLIAGVSQPPGRRLMLAPALGPLLWLPTRGRAGRRLRRS